MGTTVLIIGGVLAFLLLIVGLFVSRRDEHSLVEERLGYLEEEGMISEAEKATPMTDWLNNQAGRFSWGQGLQKSLARADLKMKVGEFVGTIFILMVGGAIIGFVAGGGLKVPLDAPFSARLGALPAVGLGALAGYLLPTFYLRNAQGKRLQHFDSQLADMLSLMVNGLRAGYSTMQAMEAVSRELPAPISDEFRRVVQEMQLGVSMEVALQNLVRRIPSKDLDLVVTAMNVQREVGGNLAEILDTISHTIRERVRVKGEVKVLTTQVMYSGKFLAIMPIGLIVVMYFLNRTYMMNFFNEETRMFGIPILITGAVLIAMGYWMMTRIADIEV